MDDLSDIVQQKSPGPENEIPRAENIVEAHVGKFLSWQASVELVSLVDELRARCKRSATHSSKSAWSRCAPDRNGPMRMEA